MERFRQRDALVAITIAALVTAATLLPAFAMLRGLSIDFLTALRWRTFGQTHAPASSPAVIIAFDEETTRTPPFDSTPQVAWTGRIARVLNAVMNADAKVIGFDVIIATSIELSDMPVGPAGERLGSRVTGFDREFLRSLFLGARAGKIVLGEVQHSEQPVRPTPAQRLAVQQSRNIRPLNLYNDPDDIIRREPLWITVDGKPTPSFALELAARALNSAPMATESGTTLAGYRIPTSAYESFTVNMEGGADDIPTYSFGDLDACIDKGDTEFFRKQFAGKVVLVGTVLDIEDRKITSKRFATAPEGARAARCALPPQPVAAFARDSIAGVYFQATAVNNLIRGEAVTELGRTQIAAINFGFAALLIAAALALSPALATLGFVVITLAWAAVSTVAFQHALALPLLQPPLAAFFALVATIGYRFVVSDKDKRLLRNMFGLYLAPAVIDRMVERNQLPELGGELRSITVYFSDVASFTALSEKLSPTDLVAVMNEYLTAMTDIIEEHGGFVDKYIGDAIVAMFGAPVDDPDHAVNATKAALACRARLAQLNDNPTNLKGNRLAQRIGLSSGEALVGNIGSRRRFNYTVMGDTVTLASRLEGANKFFATSIIAANTTVAATRDGFVWRELDAIRVKGRAQPLQIFEPIAAAGQATEHRRAILATYEKGLAAWRARSFANAADAFEEIANEDPPAAVFLKRAKIAATHPPDASWEPVNTLEDK